MSHALLGARVSRRGAGVACLPCHPCFESSVRQRSRRPGPGAPSSCGLPARPAAGPGRWWRAPLRARLALTSQHRGGEGAEHRTTSLLLAPARLWYGSRLRDTCESTWRSARRGSGHMGETRVWKGKSDLEFRASVGGGGSQVILPVSRSFHSFPVTSVSLFQHSSFCPCLLLVSSSRGENQLRVSSCVVPSCAVGPCEPRGS